MSSAILAGGESRRMGQDKGLTRLNGKSLVSYSIELAKHFSDDIHIIANSKGYAEFGLPVSPDLFEGKGPLNGICTALKISILKRVLILPCDMPFLTKEIMQSLMPFCDEFDVVIPVAAGQDYPLCGIYSTNCLERFTEALEQSKYSVIDALKSINVKRVEVESELGNTLININDKSTLELVQ